MVNHPHRSKKQERYVLVTTAHRGVFAGFAGDTSGEIIHLREARCCLFWPQEQQGFLGLASKGPLKGAKIGPKADLELRSITSVAVCTPEAEKAWGAAPWTL